MIISVDLNVIRNQLCLVKRASTDKPIYLLIKLELFVVDILNCGSIYFVAFWKPASTKYSVN